MEASINSWISILSWKTPFLFLQHARKFEQSILWVLISAFTLINQKEYQEVESWWTYKFKLPTYYFNSLVADWKHIEKKAWWPIMKLYFRLIICLIKYLWARLSYYLYQLSFFHISEYDFIWLETLNCKF